MRGRTVRKAAMGMRSCGLETVVRLLAEVSVWVGRNLRRSNWQGGGGWPRCEEWAEGR